MVFARNDVDGPRQGAFLPLVLLWLLGSVSLGLLGPYGTWVTLELQWRVLFWAGILISALTVVGGAALFTRFALPRRPYLGLAVQGGLSALILGPMIWSLCCLLPGANPDLVPPPHKIALAVFVVWLCVVVLRGLPRDAPMLIAAPPTPFDRAAPRSEPAAALPVQMPMEIIRPAFLERSDLHLPGSVMRVSADDHYLVVQTTQASGRLIMRFRDALPDLEVFPGFRIHRSHWVAAPFILRVRSEGRRHVMDLVDGSVLPVSQAYLAPLQAAGLGDQRGIGNLTGAPPTRMASAPWPINAVSSGRSQKSPPV